MGEKKAKEESSIATNSAEVAFYNKKYDVAIAEYTKMQENEKNLGECENCRNIFCWRWIL